MKKKILALLFAILLLVAFPINTFADFGDYAGDSDYGYDSYDYGSDSGYDYDDDDDDYYYHDDVDDEHTTRSYYNYIHSSHDDDNHFGGNYNYLGEALTLGTLTEEIDAEGNTSIVAGLMIAAIILCIVVSKYKKKHMFDLYPLKKDSQPAGAERTDVSSLNDMASYKNIDPDFSETDLKEKISNLYFQMQYGWQDKKLDDLRPYFTDALYAQFDRQLDAYRRNKQTNYIERIAVLDVQLNGWKQEGGQDTIIALVRTRIVDYVKDDVTGKIIRGSNTAEKFMTYEYTLSRKTGVQTTAQSGTRVITCPNCGAPVDINRSAKCEYCGNIITVDSSDWLINGIKGIAQRTK